MRGSLASGIVQIAAVYREQRQAIATEMSWATSVSLQRTGP